MNVIRNCSIHTSQGAISPRDSHPSPVVPSSGPQRTRRNAKGKRRKTLTYKKAIDESEEGDGWDAALIRFQANVIETVFDGQAPGELPPEMALAASIAKILKDELKRSVSHIVLLRSHPPFR